MRYFEIIEDKLRRNKGKIQLPQRGTKKAMAYDFFSPVDMVIKPGKTEKIWTDVRAIMQDDEALIINIRSSQGGKVMLSIVQGWVDADYSEADNGGNIGIFLHNVSEEDYVINVGDRIAQGMFINYLTSSNGNTDNQRTGGYGSTGK